MRDLTKIAKRLVANQSKVHPIIREYPGLWQHLYNTQATKGTIVPGHKDPSMLKEYQALEGAGLLQSEPYKLFPKTHTRFQVTDAGHQAIKNVLDENAKIK